MEHIGLVTTTDQLTRALEVLSSRGVAHATRSSKVSVRFTKQRQVSLTAVPDKKKVSAPYTSQTMYSSLRAVAIMKGDYAPKVS
jgi:hypothetical protein